MDENKELKVNELNSVSGGAATPANGIPCPVCQSTDTVSDRDPLTGGFDNYCNSCGHYWHTSPDNA